MSISAFLPSNVQKHPERFIAPQLASVLIQGIELGIISNQAMRFWARSHREPRVLRVVALLVLMITLLQTSVSFYAIWQLVVFNFGDFIAVVNITWATRTQPLLNGLTAAPVQGVFIWRCWKIMDRKWYILLPLVALLCGNIAALIIVTNYIVTLDTAKLAAQNPGHFPYSYIMWFVLAAALDISLTGIMLWFILRAKSQAMSYKANEILSRLTMTLWSTAIPPCAAAIVTMIVYITHSTTDFWDIFMQDILGKLYVISFFVVLNGRQKNARDLPLVSSSHNRNPSRQSAMLISRHITNQSLSGSQQIKINMSTTVDTMLDPEVESYEMKGERGRRFKRPSEITDATLAAVTAWNEDGKDTKPNSRRVSISTSATSCR